MERAESAKTGRAESAKTGRDESAKTGHAVLGHAELVEGACDKLGAKLPRCAGWVWLEWVWHEALAWLWWWWWWC